MQPAAEQERDTDLLRRVGNGEREAAREVVARFAPVVGRLARALVHDLPTADDVTQEALTRMITSAASFDPQKGRARAWVLAITRHAAHEALRQRRQVPVGSGSDVDSLLDLGIRAGWGAAERPDEAFARAEVRMHVAHALASLSVADREVLVLRDVDGLDGAETASMLGLDLPALKSRLHRARLRLAAALRAEEAGLAAQEVDQGGIRCSEVLTNLTDYIDDELGATDRCRIENHLRRCTVCERFGGRFSGAIREVREQLGVAPALDAALIERLEQRIEHDA